jgi:hypothetical protein
MSTVMCNIHVMFVTQCMEGAGNSGLQGCCTVVDSVEVNTPHVCGAKTTVELKWGLV